MFLSALVYAIVSRAESYEQVNVVNFKELNNTLVRRAYPGVVTATIYAPRNAINLPAKMPYNIKLIQGGMYASGNNFHHYGMKWCSGACVDDRKVYLSSSYDKMKTWTDPREIADLISLANRPVVYPFTIGVATTGGCPRDDNFAPAGSNFGGIERPKIIRARVRRNTFQMVVWAKIIANGGNRGNGNAFMSLVLGQSGTKKITCVLPQNIGGDMNIEYVHGGEAYFVLATYKNAISSTLAVSQDWGAYPYGKITLWRVSSDGTKLANWNTPIGCYGNTDKSRREAPDLRYDSRSRIWIFTSSGSNSWEPSRNTVATGNSAKNALQNFHNAIQNDNSPDVNRSPRQYFGGNNGWSNFNSQTTYLFIHKGLYLYMVDVYCPGWTPSNRVGVNRAHAHQRWVPGNGGWGHRVRTPGTWKLKYHARADRFYAE